MKKNHEQYDMYSVFSPTDSYDLTDQPKRQGDTYNMYEKKPVLSFKIGPCKAHLMSDGQHTSVHILNDEDVKIGETEHGPHELNEHLQTIVDNIDNLVHAFHMSKQDQNINKSEKLRSFLNKAQFKKANNNKFPEIKLNPEHGKIIANAYEQMKHEPANPHVKAAYGALIDETKHQFKDMIDKGFTFSKIKPKQPNPYKTSKDLHSDIEQNKHLHFFPTESGFGSEDSAPSDHPMLQTTEFSHEGKPLLANDLFRIVHDYRGHHLGGKSGFGQKGEQQAYLTHKKDFSPLAQQALASETMGQNQWVHHGPHGEHNQANPAKTIYAPQKAGLLPKEILNGKWHA
jgi:hypothetical protein